MGNNKNVFSESFIMFENSNNKIFLNNSYNSLNQKIHENKEFIELNVSDSRSYHKETFKKSLIVRYGSCF